MRTFFGITFRCRAAVVTTGTFMNGRIWVGRQSMPAGRSGQAVSLSSDLTALQSVNPNNHAAVRAFQFMHDLARGTMCKPFTENVIWMLQPIRGLSNRAKHCIFDARTSCSAGQARRRAQG